jgi:hypothetical protein
VILLLAAATAGIAGRAFPRWLAWPALALAILYVTPFGFFASLPVLVWTAVAGIVMVMRPADGSPDGQGGSGDRNARGSRVATSLHVWFRTVSEGPKPGETVRHRALAARGKRRSRVTRPG